MKKIIAFALVICVSLGLSAECAHDRAIKASDNYIRNRVVQLTGNEHLCSGIEIKTPSGKKAILTAAHCAALLENNMLTATSENGDEDVVSMIAIDPAHDLMLLTSLDGKSINIAKSVHKHQKVHSLTHGHGFITYRTDGEMLEERTLIIPVFEINSQEDEDKCPATPYEKIIFDFSTGKQYCMLKLTLQGITAKIVPGSSGGPILNSAGELVGIVSAGDDVFGFMVPLRSIHHFLRDK